ncbi:MAG: hypothetical protein ACTHQQ_01495 [Solirubrobacteraceae bacterium]
MTAAQPQDMDRQGVRSMEVRWILRGQLAGGVEGWFGRFPAETTALDDVYLLDPYLPGLSVKVRAGQALEVKMYRGSPGLLEVAGRARGRLEFWQKWSFPHGPPSPGSADPAGWRLVGKRRRISWFAQAIGTGVPQLGEQPGCAVELTAVDLGGEPWWTLGFEAKGPADALRRELDAAAALVFADALPSGVELGIDDSQSYVRWLCRRPATG